MKKFCKLFSAVLCLTLLTSNAGAINNLRENTTKSSDPISCNIAIAKYGGIYDYIINDYQIDINVNENNVYNIVEHYNVCFPLSNSHGIYRTIPKTMKGWRADGSRYSARAYLKNVTATGDQYETDESITQYTIKIGNPKEFVSREKSYTISYDYDFGTDKLKNGDEFYFNLIGPEWDPNVVFLNTSFSINMPKAFSYSREDDTIGITSGEIRRSRTADVDYDVVNRRIIGTSNEIYRGGEALTFRLVLPEGYYVGARKDSQPLAFGALILASALLLISYIGFAKFGKDNKPQILVQYDPPKELNPLELALLGTSNSSNALMGMLFHLAEQGYLEIDQTDNNKHFTIKKVKNYDGKDKCAEVFMERLFSYSTDGGMTVTDNELKNRFYIEAPKIVAASKVNEIRKKSYDQSSVKLSSRLVIIASIGLFVVFGLIMMQANIFGTAATVLLGMLAIAANVLAIIVGAVTRKKTPYGDQLFSSIKSYFATVKSTNVLSNQDASYFYYNYAFAYALGLQTVFSKKFKDVISEPPSWYHGSSFTDIDSFTKSTEKLGSSTFVSPSSDGGSGGGSSGGGGGGGGGGGW